jgi:hypothetical protein
VPRTLVKLIAQNRLPLTTSLSAYLQRNRAVLDVVQEFQDNKRFVPIHPHQILCSNVTARCYTHDARTVFYTDTDHLSREGAKKLIPVISSEINRHRGVP